MVQSSNFTFSVKNMRLSGSNELAHSSDFDSVAITKVGSFLYATGLLERRNHESVRLPVVGVLDLNKKRWRWIEYVGYELDHCSVFLHNDSLYVYNPKNSVGQSLLKLVRFDLVLNEWSLVSFSGDAPTKRRFSGHFLEKKSVFVVYGGLRQYDFVNTVNLLVMRESHWVKPKVKGYPPPRRFAYASCANQGKIYYYGTYSSDRRYSSKLFILTLNSTNDITWSSVKLDTLRLRGYALTPFKNTFLICGGWLLDKRQAVYVYNDRKEKLDKAKIIPSETLLPAKLRSFTIREGQSFGLIGGENRLECYSEMSLKE